MKIPMRFFRVPIRSLTGVLGLFLPAFVSAGSYEMRGAFNAVNASQSTAGSMAMHATFERERTVQSRGAMTLQSHIESPAICSSDQIFKNGFDP